MYKTTSEQGNYQIADDSDLAKPPMIAQPPAIAQAPVMAYP